MNNLKKPFARLAVAALVGGSAAVAAPALSADAASYPCWGSNISVKWVGSVGGAERYYSGSWRSCDNKGYYRKIQVDNAPDSICYYIGPGRVLTPHVTTWAGGGSARWIDCS